MHALQTCLPPAVARFLTGESIFLADIADVRRNNQRNSAYSAGNLLVWQRVVYFITIVGGLRRKVVCAEFLKKQGIFAKNCFFPIN